MLGKGNLKFRRYNFIKDLYQPKGFLNNFDTVEFDNVIEYLRAVEGDYYEHVGELRIHVNNMKEWEYLSRVLIETDMTRVCRVILIVHEWEIFSDWKKVSGLSFGVIVNMDFDYPKYKEYMRAWYQHNPIYYRVPISYDNIDIITEDMFSLYTKGHARLFELKFDWYSFEKATLGDLHRVLFRMSRIKTWEQNKMKELDEHEWLEVLRQGFRKIIFVANGLKLYYTEDHFKEGIEKELFTLQKGDGESIPYKELNRIRQYMDIVMEAMQPMLPMNFSYGDFYQNFKVHGTPNETPMIAQIVMGWLP